jgi:hypothetical protein
MKKQMDKEIKVSWKIYITPPKNPQIFSLWDERWLIINIIISFFFSFKLNFIIFVDIYTIYRNTENVKII